MLPCTHREDVEEWVDRPETPLDDIRATLRDQEVVNRWLGGTHAALAHVLPAIRESVSDPVRVLDLACGGADLSRRIVDQVRRWGRRIEVVGLEINGHAITCAHTLSRSYPEILFVRGDALRPPFRPGQFDVVLMATFLHHLPPERAIRALRIARDLSPGTLVVADLVRSPFALVGFRLFARLARFSPVSIHDGAVSVCRAYVPAELARMARQAGLRRSRIYRHPVSRMTLVDAGAGGEG